MTATSTRVQSPFIFVPMTFVIGLGIGILTLLLQKLLPDSLIQFANSGAVWSVLAFVAGRVALSRSVAVLSGVLGLCGEVAGYYTAAYFANLMDISSGTLAVIGYWLLVALVAGSIFSWAGYASVNSKGLTQTISISSLGAIFMGEGLYLLSILPVPNTGLLWLGIALALTLYGMWRHAKRLRLLLATLLLGLIFFAGQSSLVLLDRLRAELFTG